MYCLPLILGPLPQVFQTPSQIVQSCKDPFMCLTTVFALCSLLRRQKTPDNVIQCLYDTSLSEDTSGTVYGDSQVWIITSVLTTADQLSTALTESLKHVPHSSTPASTTCLRAPIRYPSQRSSYRPAQLCHTVLHSLGAIPGTQRPPPPPIVVARSRTKHSVYLVSRDSYTSPPSSDSLVCLERRLSTPAN